MWPRRAAVESPIWPAGPRLLETPALADNAINLTLPRSHPLDCHRAPQVLRLGTDCIPQGLSTSLTHPWHLTGTRGSLAAPLTLPEGILGIPSCSPNLLPLHGPGRTRQDEEFASRALKNSRTPVTAGGVSAAPGLRTSTGAPPQALPLNLISLPLLWSSTELPWEGGDAAAPGGARQAGEHRGWEVRSSRGRPCSTIGEGTGQ